MASPRSDMLTIGQTSRFTGLSKEVLREWRERRNAPLRPIKMYNKFYYPINEVMAYIKEHSGSAVIEQSNQNEHSIALEKRSPLDSILALDAALMLLCNQIERLYIKQPSWVQNAIKERLQLHLDRLSGMEYIKENAANEQ